MYFDVAMPLTLFLVTLAAVFLNKKAERKLETTFEERKFAVRDALMLVASITVMVSLVVFVPQSALMIVFLFSYSMLLFIFTYIFSDLSKTKTQLFLLAILVASFVAGTISLPGLGIRGTVAAGSMAFFTLAAFAFLTLVYEHTRNGNKERLYLAVFPPALFICLYMFFSRTPIWFPYLLDIYGVVFAVLIILYLGSLFTWKTLFIFIGLLTVMDVILVLYTGTMVSAAKQASGLALPVLISVPTIPFIATPFGLIYMSLGLGDFFFAGLIAVQSYKKHGRAFALLSIVAMCVSFFAFETYMFNSDVNAFPGTLMIICGWLPLLLWSTRTDIRQRRIKILYGSTMFASIMAATLLLVNYVFLASAHDSINGSLAFVVPILYSIFAVTLIHYLHENR